jgi:hypothetical protein
VKSFPHGRDGRAHGVGWLGAGRVLAGVATALLLMAAGFVGLRTDVLGMREWPGISDEAARTQIVPDRIPLVTPARAVKFTRGSGAHSGRIVTTAAQPTSPSAQSTPLPVGTGGGTTATVVPVTGPVVGVAPRPTVPVDTDGDGLSDAAEARLGTDPRRRDTDGDGLPDGWEVGFGLNPRNDLDAGRDPDHDGVDNRNEFLTRSNPRAADTNHDGVIDGRDDPDGDGIPTAVEQDLGLDPARGDTPPSRREPARGVADATMPGPSADVLLAAHRTGLDLNEPAASDGALDSDGDGLPNAVELRLGTDPAGPATNGVDDATADADGDGLPNALEVVLGLDPGNPDTNGDGTPDAREDSDGDGVPNGVELALSLDPSTADTDGDGTPDGAVDSDADGTSNAAELAAGRDPAYPDPAPNPAPEPPAESEPSEPVAPPEEPSPAPPPADVTPPPADVTPPPVDVTPPPADVAPPADPAPPVDVTPPVDVAPPADSTPPAGVPTPPAS